MNLDLNIYAILITKYEKLNSLPSNWDKIEDIKLKAKTTPRLIQLLEEYDKSLSENIYNKANDKSR